MKKLFFFGLLAGPVFILSHFVTPGHGSGFTQGTLAVIESVIHLTVCVAALYYALFWFLEPGHRKWIWYALLVFIAFVESTTAEVMELHSVKHNIHIFFLVPEVLLLIYVLIPAKNPAFNNAIE